MTSECLPIGPRPVWRDHDIDPRVRAIIVAVPARDEADRILTCLRSVEAAAGACPDLRVVIVVAADSCTDDTARLATGPADAVAGHLVVEGSWRAVGGARAAAVEAGLAAVDEDPSAVWIANTDADCAVPSGWLRTQLRHAARADAVTGIVRLDPATTPTALRRRFLATYACGGREHRHVHGANLGVRADAYGAVGGWARALTLGEDHELWGRLAAAGHRMRQPTDLAVTTSGRTSSRVDGGFASDMACLVTSGRVEQTA